MYRSFGYQLLPSVPIIDKQWLNIPLAWVRAVKGKANDSIESSTPLEYYMNMAIKNFDKIPLSISFRISKALKMLKCV